MRTLATTPEEWPVLPEFPAVAAGQGGAEDRDEAVPRAGEVELPVPVLGEERWGWCIRSSVAGALPPPGRDPARGARAEDAVSVRPAVAHTGAPVPGARVRDHPPLLCIAGSSAAVRASLSVTLHQLTTHAHAPQVSFLLSYFIICLDSRTERAMLFPDIRT